MNIKKLFLIIDILVLLSTADSFGQLTKIWGRSNDGFALESICVPGKLAILSLDGYNHFIDLTNGKTIFVGGKSENISTNYWGD